MPELLIKHVSIAIHGETKSDPSFKEFKYFFGFIDLDKRTVWKWPNTVLDWRHWANEVLL